MSSASVLAEIRRFFADWDGAGLKLPDGWFGRPHDNVLELTDCRTSDAVLIVELDHRHLLVVEGGFAVDRNGQELSIYGFSSALWRWTDYGSEAVHEQTYKEGKIQFLA